MTTEPWVTASEVAQHLGVAKDTVYRWRDIVDQTGIVAFSLYNLGFFGGQFFGIVLAHGINNPGAGAGAGIGFYVIFAIISAMIARTPDTAAPSFWNSNVALRKFWFLAFYSVSSDPILENFY